MPVRVVRLRGVRLAGWVKHRPNRRGGLVRSTKLNSRLSSRPSSRRRVASDPLIRPSNLNLKLLACSGAAVHSQPKINRWAASVCLIISLRIIDLPVPQAVLAVLERIPILDLLVFLVRPIPRSNNNLLLPVCLRKISQVVVHLVGVHLVCATQSSARLSLLILNRCQCCWPETIHFWADPTTTSNRWRLWVVWISATTGSSRPSSTGHYRVVRKSARIWTG